MKTKWSTVCCTTASSLHYYSQKRTSTLQPFSMSIQRHTLPAPISTQQRVLVSASICMCLARDTVCMWYLHTYRRAYAATGSISTNRAILSTYVAGVATCTDPFECTRCSGQAHGIKFASENSARQTPLVVTLQCAGQPCLLHA
jgi:hypothetical protein